MKFYRLNQQIGPTQLRVLDEANKQIGVLSRAEALAKAQELGLDLVEIAPTAKPPVCKIIDFKKFRYLEEKRERELRKKTKQGGLKELRLGPFMSENDIQVRIERGREFLKDGHKLRLAVKFAGRQITHPEFGWQLIHRLIKELEEYGTVEREPKLEGKVLATTLTPGKHKTKISYGKTKNKEGSSKALRNNKDG